MASATAEVEEKEETQTKRTRIALSEENQYWFPAETNEDEIKGNVILKEDGSQADQFRPYTVKSKDDKIVGYAFAKVELEALGRFAESKEYSTELTYPGQRGKKAGPVEVEPLQLKAITKLFQLGERDMVLEFLQEPRNANYRPHFPQLASEFPSAA